MTVEERSRPLGQPYSRDELWAESHHVGLALENGPIDRLRRDVDRLAVEIGPRNIYHYEALQKAADHLETSLRETGYSPLLHRYEPMTKPSSISAPSFLGGSTKTRSSSLVRTTTRTRTLRARMTMGPPLPHFSNWRAILLAGRWAARCASSLSQMKRARSLVVKLWGAVSMPANAGDVETTSSA